MSRPYSPLLHDLLVAEQARRAALNERRRALGLPPMEDLTPPTSQHLDGDPERSMQEGLVDP